MGANQLAAPSVLTAVLAVLRADPTLGALLSVSPLDGGAAVYQSLAPQTAPYEFLVVDAVSETPANTIGRGWGAAVLLSIRAVSRRLATAQAIISRAIALLDYPEMAYTVTGYTTAVGEFVTAGPGYPEEVRGEVIQHYPAVVRVTVHRLEDAGSPDGSPA